MVFLGLPVENTGMAWINSGKLIDRIMLSLFRFSQSQLLQLRFLVKEAWQEVSSKLQAVSMESNSSVKKDKRIVQGFPLMPGDNAECRTWDRTVTARGRTRHPEVCGSSFCSRVEKVGGTCRAFGGKRGEQMEHVLDLLSILSRGCSYCAYHGCHLGPFSRVWDEALVLQFSWKRCYFSGRVQTSWISLSPLCLKRGWGIPCSAGEFLRTVQVQLGGLWTSLLAEMQGTWRQRMFFAIV